MFIVKSQKYYIGIYEYNAFTYINATEVGIIKKIMKIMKIMKIT